MPLTEFDAGSGRPMEDAPPTGERIRAETIRLYTDPTQNQVQTIALQQLLESPFNPRQRFDAKALQELADNIRSVGVMQPLLARPIPLDNISQGGKPVQAYEIVYGHRRYRAAGLAEEATVPVIVRELTDAQAKQLQAIENVQRQDLDPVEEARSYRNYLEAHGVNKDQLAAEMGLSRSHVYGRLKLLEAVPQVQEACSKGEIGPDVALFIARLHTPKLQEKALASLQSNHIDFEDGGKRSVRKVRDFLRERFTLQLREAIFDTKDAALLPDADACTTCPKRTGNAPEFEDLANDTEKDWQGKRWAGPDLCTDADCFEAKKKEHLRRKALALTEKGKTVITGGKARAAISAQGEIKGGYIALKDVKAQLAKKGKKPADVETVVIQDPRTGKTFDAVAPDALAAAGIKVKADAAGGQRDTWQEQQRRREEEQKRNEEKAQALTQTNLALLKAVREAVAKAPRSAFDLQLIAHVTLSGVDYHSRPAIASLHGCKSVEALQKQIGQMDADQLATLLLDCALVDDVKVQAYQLNKKPEALLAAAKHYGISAQPDQAVTATKPAKKATKKTPAPAGADTDAAPAEAEEAEA